MAAPISTTYSPDRRAQIIDHALEQLAQGRALSKICDDEGMPTRSTVIKWISEDPELEGKVMRAREIGVEALLDQTLEIADTHEKGIIRTIKPDGTIEEREEDMLGHRKLRIHARHQYAQMIAPRRFGPKVDVTSGGEKLPAPQVNQAVLVDARIQSLVHLAVERATQVDEETRRLME